MEFTVDLSKLKQYLEANVDISKAKQFLRWTWLRCSTKSATVGRRRRRNVDQPHQKGLAAVLNGEEEAPDVTFIIGDRLFPAHRGVLAARSPVFKAELFGPMNESSSTNTRPIEIHDMEPSIFEALLGFIYTDDLAADYDKDDAAPLLQHLLVAADRYAVHGLAAACEWKLCRSIDVDNVATTLALAEQHHRGKLKDACIAFVSSKTVLEAIRETDGFNHLVQSCPLVMMDILEQKLPSSRVAWGLTVFGTRVQQSLTLFGTKVRQSVSLFGTKVQEKLTQFRTQVTTLFADEEFQHKIRICLAFVSSFGFIVVIVKNLDSSSAAEGRTAASLHRLRLLVYQLPRDWRWLLGEKVRSSLDPAALLRSLKKFQESAWLNSDI
ncbi:BTB/POZ and MATH domain-containing protein 3 [Brachypodium distachyon]|uniref:BTB domain-containing protein n=1 Tax=Brachypodium distachyon TaxID=15368 RepID=A0A2K2CIP3_BRADI|nr:BTB/POZ and MATH domain-containing protein 3 [Brachypodium distachyon]PNT61889.1 hypothetical protein BRADI_5g22391v3 [Brachypodium distachyon]|eukprot:XP_010227277.1 BTB/POZ and MATH domain-containing protein 3 [Brachypodium distachyon]